MKAGNTMGVWHEAVSQYGYIAIFTLLTMGLLGLPVPDEVLVTYLGYITSLGEMSFTITFFISCVWIHLWHID